MPAKKRMTVRERQKKNAAQLAKLSPADRAHVKKRAAAAGKLPITGARVPRSKTKATAAAIKSLAGQPGAFQSKPKGDIRLSRRRKK